VEYNVSGTVNRHAHLMFNCFRSFQTLLASDSHARIVLAQHSESTTDAVERLGAPLGEHPHGTEQRPALAPTMSHILVARWLAEEVVSAIRSASWCGIRVFRETHLSTSTE
jgi:hypothetical protein